MRSFLAASTIAAAAAGPANIPTVPICSGRSGAGTCYKMPVVGQGSCCGAYNISSALAAGFTHIDTSVDYGSQPTIAAAIAASGIPRAELWVTSKLNVESCATDMSGDLQKLVLGPLNMTYVDLLLIHHAGRWETDKNPHPPCFDATQAGPAGNGTYYQCRLDTVVAMEKLVAAGLARTWGVSNWQIRDLEQMHDVYGFYPAINQIECVRGARCGAARRRDRVARPAAHPRAARCGARGSPPAPLPRRAPGSTRGGRRTPSSPSATSTASSSRATRRWATATARTCATRPSLRSSRRARA